MKHAFAAVFDQNGSYVVEDPQLNTLWDYFVDSKIILEILCSPLKFGLANETIL